MDPFAAALDALFHAPGSAAAAYYPIDGNSYPDPIRIIRSQPTEDLAIGSGVTPVLTNIVEIRRSEVPEPREGDLLALVDETDEDDMFAPDEQPFKIVGVPRLDVEGLTWSCEIIPDD